MNQSAHIEGGTHSASGRRAAIDPWHQLLDNDTPVEFSEEDVVRLHWWLLQKVKLLSSPGTPLAEKFEIIRWVFTDPERDTKPFSFVNCLRVVSCSPLCEGIETGIAILKRTAQPIWIGICARNLESMWIPDEVRRLRIYGDNDADSMYDGQASSYILARQFLKRPVTGERRSAEVFIPRAAGADWANVLAQHAPIVDRAA